MTVSPGCGSGAVVSPDEVEAHVLKASLVGSLREFDDLEFKATEDALSFIRSSKPSAVIKWSRPHEWLDFSLIFLESDPRSGDVIQGALGDCWLLGALAAVALKPKFWVKGAWRPVAIDSRLPTITACGETGLLFARSWADQEMWVPLIEKAYAKLHGGYSALNGGHTLKAMVQLTGGSGVKLCVEKTSSDEEHRRLWERLSAYSKLGFLLACSHSVKGTPPPLLGLLANHAYSVLSIHQCSSGTKMLHVRDPWGMSKWKGQWRKDGPGWSQNPGVRSELKLKQKQQEKKKGPVNNGGSFWVDFDEFVQHFNRLFVCKLFPPSWKEVSHRFGWSEASNTNGGSHLDDSWCYNPQYSFCVEQPCTAHLSVLSTSEGDLMMGMHLFSTGDRSKRVWQVDGDDPCVDSIPASKRSDETVTEVPLRTHIWYTLVLSTGSPAEQGEYLFRLWAKHAVRVVSLPLVRKASIQGEWNARCAAGRSYCVESFRNPKYEVLCPSTAKSVDLFIKLACRKQPEKSKKREKGNRIGFCIVQGRYEECSPIEPSEVFAESMYISPMKASAVVTVDANTPYTIFPSTEAEGFQGQFQLTLFSCEESVSITELSPFWNIKQKIPKTTASPPVFAIVAADSSCHADVFVRVSQKSTRVVDDIVGFQIHTMPYDVSVLACPLSKSTYENAQLVAETSWVPGCIVSSRARMEAGEMLLITSMALDTWRCHGFTLSVTSTAYVECERLL